MNDLTQQIIRAWALVASDAFVSSLDPRVVPDIPHVIKSYDLQGRPIWDSGVVGIHWSYNRHSGMSGGWRVRGQGRFRRFAGLDGLAAAVAWRQAQEACKQ